MSNFETTIQTYLENRAKTDSLFAETYNPETLICQACDKSFKEGFQKGAKWLEKKRIDRIMNKDKEVQNDNRK